MELLRQRYIDIFTSYKTQQLITVVTGQRRVGKSTFLRQLQTMYDSSMLLDLEYFEYSYLLDAEVLYSYLKERIVREQLGLVAIDEMQLVSGRERVILSLAKSYPQTKFVVTGSNSRMLASDLTTLLRGRYIQIHMLPFGYDEYISYLGEKTSQETYGAYLSAGSFPYIYSLSLQNQKRDRIESLINTIFLKDIVERYNIRNPELLRQLFLFILDTAGSIINIQNIKNALKQQQIYVTIDTLQEYMQHLTDCYMIYPVELFDIQGKKIFDRMRKYYPSDHVWRSILMGGFDLGVGKSLETVVYMTLLRYTRKVQVGRFKDKEVDFIAIRGEQKMYIQVTYMLNSDEVIKREYESLMVIKDNYPKYIVSMDPIPLGQKEGIRHIQAWKLDEILKE